MRTVLTIILATWVASAFAADAKLTDAPKPPDGFPRFKVQEIDAGLKIGYAVITADIDADGKPDVVVVDQHKVVWYQNPTWKKRVILDGTTKPDNVCVTALDIDRDALPELVLGAGWKPFDTKNPGTLQWLKRGKTLDDEWTMHAIPCDEPTVHRVRSVDLDGDGKAEVVMAPLMGRDATKEKNWMDGRPVRLMAYKVPASAPEKAESWKSEVISADLHVVHGFTGLRPVADLRERRKTRLYMASYEGLFCLTADQGKWASEKVGDGDQTQPTASRGSSEVAVGVIRRSTHLQDMQIEEKTVPDAFAATIEPWHGNQLVVYQSEDGNRPWLRTVIDRQMRWGHVVRAVDLGLSDSYEARGKQFGTTTSVDSLVVGVRDNPTNDDKFKEQRGVRLYRFDAKSKKWERYILEDGGVAVEDLTVADLNADGNLDIIAVGRATGNARIYWNQGR